jgi:hypothetical protein
MKRLTLALVLCGLVISGTATADQTCKAKAARQKLAGRFPWERPKNKRPNNTR